MGFSGIAFGLAYGGYRRLVVRAMFYSAGFDPRLHLGCTIKFLKCTEAGGIAWVVVVVCEMGYLVKPVVLATSQPLLSFLQRTSIAGHHSQIVQRQSYHSTAMPG